MKKKWEVEAEKIQAEKELMEREKELIDTEKIPQTAMEWDKYMLANPQNSMLWLRYMAFHLHSMEVEKARLVGEKALKAIDFNDEQERLNVWIGLLNMENDFGTAKSLKDVIIKALSHNDPLKLNMKLVEIYEKSEKLEEAEDVYKKMLKKFRFNEDVWTSYMTFLMRQGRSDDANDIMKRSLTSLNKKQHVNILSKFAQLEFKVGDPERGCTVFENILSSFAKRADIWLVYLDMLIRENRLEDARNVLERVTTLNFSAKNMKTFYKRFIQFEEKFGNDSNVAEIKQKAMDYLESKTLKLIEG